MMLGTTSELREKELPVWYWHDEITERWKEFVERNPVVMDTLNELMREAYIKGRKRIGIGMLFEVMRWELNMTGLPDEHESFKMPNEYRSRYARRLMDLNPQWEGMFSVKQCEGARYRSE